MTLNFPRKYEYDSTCEVSLIFPINKVTKCLQKIFSNRNFKYKNESTFVYIIIQFVLLCIYTYSFSFVTCVIVLHTKLCKNNNVLQFFNV